MYLSLARWLLRHFSLSAPYAVEFDGGPSMAYIWRYVQTAVICYPQAMRDSDYNYVRLREARQRFKENRYEPRRAELWAEVEYWEWRLGRRD